MQTITQTMKGAHGNGGGSSSKVANTPHPLTPFDLFFMNTNKSCSFPVKATLGYQSRSDLKQEISVRIPSLSLL